MAAIDLQTDAGGGLTITNVTTRTALYVEKADIASLIALLVMEYECINCGEIVDYSESESGLCNCDERQ